MGKTPDFPNTIHTELFIDGQFVAGEGEAERVLNPATGELIAQVPEASFEQIHRAVLGSLERFFGILLEHTAGVPPREGELPLLLLDAVTKAGELTGSAGAQVDVFVKQAAEWSQRVPESAKVKAGRIW